jgi:hypothetical protein
MTSDGVDTGSDAFHRPAAPPSVADGIQEHSASKRIGRGPGVPYNYADLVKDWQRTGQVTNNPGGASSSSTTPAANPPSQPSRAAHEGHGGKARMTSDFGRYRL